MTFFFILGVKKRSKKSLFRHNLQITKNSGHFQGVFRRIWFFHKNANWGIPVKPLFGQKSGEGPKKEGGQITMGFSKNLEKTKKKTVLWRTTPLATTDLTKKGGSNYHGFFEAFFFHFSSIDLFGKTVLLGGSEGGSKTLHWDIIFDGFWTIKKNVTRRLKNTKPDHFFMIGKWKLLNFPCHYFVFSLSFLFFFVLFFIFFLFYNFIFKLKNKIHSLNELYF